MEYAVFVIGIVALIVSVVISGKISKRSEEEIVTIKEELKSFIELAVSMTVENQQAFFNSKYDYVSQKIIQLSSTVEDSESTLDDHDDRINEVESNTDKLQSQASELQELIDEAEKNIESHQQRLYETESILEKLVDDAQIIVPPAPWIQQDYATYLENDASVIVHLDAAAYELGNAIIFMAYMLQDLKDRVYGERIVTHEEEVQTKKKHNTRRKKVSTAGDTNSDVTGSQPS